MDELLHSDDDSALTPVAVSHAYIQAER